MLAFGWEQNHRLGEAEAAARRALALQPDEPWAQHALAHVLLTDGRLAEGAAFLQSASAGWQGLTSFMRCHNWWHLALFQIELGDDAAALRLYDSQVWGVDTTYSQDQVGAVSLLARLELAGVAVGGRWDALATHLAGRTADQVQPFLDLQYLYGLARAGRPEAETLLANIVRFAPLAPAASRSAWQQVALPAARGLLAHAGGMRNPQHADWSAAADALAQALPGLAGIGGSHAQRDLFAQIHLDALQRAGRLAAVQHLLQPQANAQPQSQRLQRRLHAVYAAAGPGGALNSAACGPAAANHGHHCAAASESTAGTRACTVLGCGGRPSKWAASPQASMCSRSPAQRSRLMPVLGISQARGPLKGRACALRHSMSSTPPWVTTATLAPAWAATTARSACITRAWNTALLSPPCGSA
jgi:hypothetical protein